MIDSPFISKTFLLHDRVNEDVDHWLNSLSQKGIGMTVVGYVTFKDAAMLTVKRWELTANGTYSRFQQTVPPAPTTIDEHPEEPCIQVPEDEEELPLAPSCKVCGAPPGGTHDGDAHTKDSPN